MTIKGLTLGGQSAARLDLGSPTVGVSASTDREPAV